MRHLLLLVFALSALGCPPRGGGGGGGGDDDDGDWNVEVVNDSSVVIGVLRHRPCPSEDPEDWNDINLGAAGIADGESHRMLMPAPGCYALYAEGGGCTAEWQTGALQIGDQASWTLEDGDLACAG